MMKQSTVAGLALALALLACPVLMTQAKEPELVTYDRGLTDTVMTMRLTGNLTFGPDGAVKEHKVTTTELDPAVAAFVDKTVDDWKFRPYLQDGVPVNAKTYFQMTLAARPKGEAKYEISVDHVSFTDDDTFGKRKDEVNKSKCVIDCMVSQPPALSYFGGTNGGVVIHLYLNPDGTVADAVVGQSALYGVRGTDRALNDARKAFEKMALNYARRVRFAPGSGSPLVGDNHRVGALPFIFQMQGTNSDNLGKWRLEQRGKRYVATWLANDPDRWVGVSDTSGSGFVAMQASPYKLVSASDKAP